jgi:hypothetical protein
MKYSINPLEFAFRWFRFFPFVGMDSIDFPGLNSRCFYKPIQEMEKCTQRTGWLEPLPRNSDFI